MDAERRHELQENELAKLSGKSPNYFTKNLNLILLLITLGLLVWVVLNYRARAREQNELLLSEGLGSARNMLAQLESSLSQGVMLESNRLRMLEAQRTLANANVANAQPPDMKPLFDAQQQNNESRLTMARGIEQSIESVLASSPSPAQQAVALVTRADLHWHMANLPAGFTSTTRPVEGATTRSSADYLQLAEDDYRGILKDHADNGTAVMQALFGLAAISENRGEWDKASDWYAKVEADPLAKDFHKKVAVAKRAAIADIRKPVILPTTGPAK